MWILSQWQKKEQMGRGIVHTRKKRHTVLKSVKESWTKAADWEKCGIKGRICLSRRGILEHIYAVWMAQWRRQANKQDTGIQPWRMQRIQTHGVTAFERVILARGKTSRIGRLRITALFLDHWKPHKYTSILRAWWLQVLISACCQSLIWGCENQGVFSCAEATNIHGL